MKRLKEVRAIHKEYRRYTEMPSKPLFTNLPISSIIVGLMSKPCQCCNGWNKKKHPCSHDICEKPCKRLETEKIAIQNQKLMEQLSQKQSAPAQPRLSKEALIQQQIKNVYSTTMQKIQQMSTIYQQQQLQLEIQHKLMVEQKDTHIGVPLQ